MKTLTKDKIMQIEEEFRRNNESVDFTTYAAWLHNLPKPRRTRLMKATAISDDLVEVYAYFLDFCLDIFKLDETKARA